MLWQFLFLFVVVEKYHRCINNNNKAICMVQNVKKIGKKWKINFVPDSFKNKIVFYGFLDCGFFFFSFSNEPIRPNLNRFFFCSHNWQFFYTTIEMIKTYLLVQHWLNFFSIVIEYDEGNVINNKYYNNGQRNCECQFFDQIQHNKSVKFWKLKSAQMDDNNFDTEIQNLEKFKWMKQTFNGRTIVTVSSVAVGAIIIIVILAENCFGFFFLVLNDTWLVLS